MTEDTEETNNNNDQSENDGLNQEQKIGDSQQEGSRRRRKVRRRIRIKKKTGPKKKIRKYLERILWIIVIGGFIATLIILVRQLDIQDPSAKRRKKLRMK